MKSASGGDLPPADSTAGRPAGMSSVLSAIADMLQRSTVPMAIIHGKPEAVSFNAAFQEQLAFSDVASEAPANSVPMWLGEILDHAIAAGCRVEAVSYRDHRVDRSRQDLSSDAWFDLTFSPVIDDAGACHGVLLVAIETTEKVTAVRARKFIEERHRLALGGPGVVGMWDLQLASSRVSADAQIAELCGIDPEEAAAGVPLERFLTSIDKQDQARVEAQLARAMERTSAFHFRCRLWRGHAVACWIAVSGWPVLDEASPPGNFTGIAMDVTEAAEASAALADSELRLRTLTETLPQIVWSSEADGLHDYFNRQWYEFTGIAKEHVGPLTWRQLVHPDDQERVFSYWQQCLESGAKYDIEYRFRHRSGEYRWLRVMALPMRNARGKVTHWFGTATDIHEAKLLAAQRELIAGELNHRLKNLFSLVQALIVLSSASWPEAKPYAKQLAGRFSALARVYDMSRPAGEDAQLLMALFARLFAPYNDPANERIRIEGADIEIDEVAASTFSLILHELATNAAKYGALSTPGGRVRVTVELLDDRCRITWKESGGPATAAPSDAKRGFGSRLLSVSIESQFGGQMRHHWERDGLRFVADMPVDRLKPLSK
jgi:PAS domain S-box-containing protein